MRDDVSTSQDQGATPGATDGSPAARSSRWEDFVDIFYAPSSVFARRERSGFAVPMLVVTLLVGAISFANSGVMQPIMDAEFERASAATMRNNPQITAEMMERGRGVGETFAKIGAFIFVPVAIFLVGLCLWAVGKLFDAKQALGAAITVAAYSYLPRVLEAVVYGLQGLFLDPASMNGRYRLSIGPARFLDPDTQSPLLIAILGRLDLFTIWITVLLAIGLAVTGRIPRGRAAMAAALVWVLGALPGVLGALRN